MKKYSVFESIVGREGWSNRPAILGDKRCSYGELIHQSEALSEKLKNLCNKEKPFIAICLPESLEYIVSLIAVYQAGGIIIPINPNAPANDKEYVLNDAGADLVITNNKNIKSSPCLGLSGKEDTWDDVHVLGLSPQRELQAQNTDRVIIYTSGSTGRPKGSVLTDHSLSSNIMAVADYLALSPNDKTIVFTPPAFAYAISQILSHLWVGGSVLPWSHGLTFPAQFLQCIAEERITGIAANPSSLRIFTSQETSSALKLETVRYVMSGGQPLFLDLVHKIYDTFPMSRVVNMYGCTENSPRISYYWIPIDFKETGLPCPAGYPVTGTKIKIIDEEGRETPSNKVGHILIQGSSLMRGYLGDNSITNSKLRDGWFHTGDLGYYDESGALNLTGRSDNIISTGHVKVSPEEVEAVIGKVDGVVDVAVGAMPDELLDSVVVALIETGENKENLLKDIKVNCRLNLFSPKVPRKYFFVENVPKTLYGKIDRTKVNSVILNLSSNT